MSRKYQSISPESAGGPFGRWLVQMIDNYGYTVSQLADKIDVHPSEVYRWIYGQAHPNTKNVFKLATTLRTNVSILLSIIHGNS